MRSQRKREIRQRAGPSLDRCRCDRPLTTVRIHSIVLPTDAFCIWRDVMQLEFLNRSTPSPPQSTWHFREPEGEYTRVRQASDSGINDADWRRVVHALPVNAAARSVDQNAQRATPAADCARLCVGSLPFQVPMKPRQTTTAQRRNDMQRTRILLPVPISHVLTAPDQAERRRYRCSYR
jgi:hypothetical protein